MNDSIKSQKCDTFPKLLLRNAAQFTDLPSIREKEFGIWQTWTWKQAAAEIESFANGLAALGFRRGDKLAIIGDNRPHLYWAMAAAQSLGGIPVPAYQDSAAEEMQYVLEHSEARFVVAEDQEQVDKVLEVWSRCPRLEEIIYKDVRGIRDYDHSHLHDYAKIQQQGREFEKSNPEFVLRQIENGNGSDIAIILYTSGTTGTPKGVILTQDNVLITALNSVNRDGLKSTDQALAYLPMAWVGDHIFSYGQSYVSGFCVNCPESGATVMEDLREIGPSYFFAPPRILENLLTTVMIRMEDAGWLKRMMFKHFMAIAKRVGVKILEKKSVSIKDRILYFIGWILVYGPLKNTLGFSRIRLAYTAGEAIGPDIFNFYRSLGINIKQLYGQTESAVFITMQPDGEVKADTVGTPATDVEIRIADNGEVLYRGPGVFQSYYKNPQATAETKSDEGWVHTGDAGYFDESGHLKIIDRAKDVGKMRDGSLFAPKYLENKLKFFPQIKEAIAFGDNRDYASAIINIDLEAVGNWAERKNISYASYQELAAVPEVHTMLRDCIEQVNRDLSVDSNLAASQIRRFLVLHKELDPDDGELTRTRKVRRRFVADKYSDLIAALYSEREHCHIKSEVTYEDGRKGEIEADLKINPAKIFGSLAETG